MPSNNGATAFALVEQKQKLKVPLLAENILGRESGLKTETMSRRHCQIVTKENRWFLADLGSTNGTYLNGKKMKSREWYAMKVGDELEFGSLVFKFTGPPSRNEANVVMPDAETLSDMLPKDENATSRHRAPPPKAEPKATEEAANDDTENPLPESVGFGPRLLAYFIDFSVMCLFSAAAFYFVNLKQTLIINLVQLMGLILVVIVPTILQGQSLGKMVMKLRVAAGDGHPGAAKVILREFAGKVLLLLILPAALAGFAAAIIPMLGAVVGLAVPVGLVIYYQKTGEAFWDLLFKTRVIRTEPAIEDEEHA